MIEAIAQQVGLRISDRAELTPRLATLLPPPEELHADVRAYLNRKFPNGLYSHQSKAIIASLAGDGVCLSTSTASGKSLVFMSVAADLLKRDSHACVVAFYPARALIQDQLEKWKEMLEPLGFSVSFIDSSVAVGQRSDILQQHRVILMTPDVAHAWFMRSIGEQRIASVRKNLGLLVLDEAHVYDGVFGTNMAYFLRRLLAVCKPPRLICSTATLGKSNDFIFQLTGCNTIQFGADQEGASIPKKTILAARISANEGFELSAKLLKTLARQYEGRFIAFADSRKMVELMTDAAYRADRENAAPDDETLEELADETAKQLMPYRAGYESADRLRIQEGLHTGTLRGVVSTSALELGLDIGEVNLVVLLTTPPSMKSFWQRIGRAGRVSEGHCLMLDPLGISAAIGGGLRGYLKRPIEPNWLYLDNRYIQYTNALCAAQERRDAGELYDTTHFSTMPQAFAKFVDEELEQTQSLADDLFALRQRAQGVGPHLEFPLRSGVERSYKVESQQRGLGTLTFPQVLREAYPGAIYRYMGRPFRVFSINHRAGEILVTPGPHTSTKPITQVMVFPKLQGGVHRLLVGGGGFTVEADLQVSERVVGFKEKRGASEVTHNYAVGSQYAQQPLQRFIKTTGVCWYFSEPLVMSDSVAAQVLETFCREFAIQPRDLGIGRFHVQQSPLGTVPLQGIGIFDATHGSMRLTERLGQNFAKVIRSARYAVDPISAGGVVNPLTLAFKVFCVFAESLAERPPVDGQTGGIDTALATEWIEVVAPGESALLVSETEAREVVVLRYFFTPAGIKYQLKHSEPTVHWVVEIGAIQPLSGTTRTVRYNPTTGDEQPMS